MKINLPLTGQEKRFSDDYTLVSRTDTKGIITFANDKFIEVSGFSREELIGRNHNIIRHPDVPPVIFEGMWNTLKRGLPWRGVVKNRCKNGDHYWVDAKVVPVKKNGEIIGYMSVRSCPSRDAIAAAEQAYQDAARAPEKIRGQATSAWKRYFSIKNGVTLGIIFVTLLMIAGGILGITGLNLSSSAMRSLYEQGLSPVQTIGRINFLMADNRAQVALALHHDPARENSGKLEHTVNTHLENINHNKQEIDVLWESYRQRVDNGLEKDLADRYWQARTRYVDDGLLKAKAALQAQDYRQAEGLLLSRVNPLYDEANANATVLLRHLSERAKGDYNKVAERNRDIMLVAITGIALSSLAMILAGFYFFRATVMPLQGAVVALEDIAEGDLTGDVAIDALGEPGRVMAAVTVMQMHLKVMMNEIRQSSESIRVQCRNLNKTMMNLSEQSDEQHDRVYQTLDASLDSCLGLDALAGDAEALMEAMERQTAGESLLPPPTESLTPKADPVMAAAESDEPPSWPEEFSADVLPEAPTAERNPQTLASELVSTVRIQTLAIEEVATHLRQVASLIVENREEVQAAWAASQQLEKTAVELDNLVKYFES